MPERALAAKAGAETSVAPKTKPRARMAEYAYEREAKEVASSIVSAPRAATPPYRGMSGDTLAMPGRALDAATRGFMESRFGYDFGRVRIHDDERAGDMARALDARAYTTGASIVFARDAYDPSSQEGRELLAHELTHVVQQWRTPSIARIAQRQGNPAPPTPTVWYQEAIDQVAASQQDIAQQAKQGPIIIEPSFFENQKAVLALCEAVDKKLTADIPKKLDALLKVGFGNHLDVMSRELMNEVAARMYELTLESDAARLRKAYAAADQVLGDDMYRARRTVGFLTSLTDAVIRDGKAGPPNELTASIHRYTRVFLALRDEYLAIDFQALEDERRFQTGRFVLRPGMSHEEYYDAITGQIEHWERGLSTLIQGAMDGARHDLESQAPTGDGVAMLTALHTALAGELHDVLFPADGTKNINDVSMPITHTTITKGKGTMSDEFAQGKEAKAREIPVTTYDPEQDFAPELRASLATFWKVRMQQLDVIGQLYGVTQLLLPEKTPAETKAKEERAKDTAQTIRDMTGGRLRLDSDDDWRDFLIQRYKDLTKPKQPPKPPAKAGGEPAPAPAAKKAATPAEALHEIITLLFDYLHAYTVHVRFTNIYDTGDPSYIDRPFPRALTGQLEHDCGVYALRVAYMLSLVRMHLGLRFRFVVLPVHVSLVITGNKDMPAYIIENDQFTEIKDLEAKRKEWLKFKDTTKSAKDDEQFIAELASAEFIRGPVDMPFKVTDVPKPVKSAKAEQKQLWDYYKQEATKELFGPSAQKKGDPNFQFQLRYLELTEQSRDLYNEAFLPFWNDAAPQAWEKFAAKLAGGSATPGKGATPRTELEVSALLNEIADYRTDYDKALQPAKQRYDAYEDSERQLSKDLRADPKLKRFGVRYSVGARANMFWSYYWDMHNDKLDEYMVDLSSRSQTSKEKVDATVKTILPPWIPRQEHHLDPLD